MLKAASKTVFTARRNATFIFDLPLARIVLALLAFGEPAQIFAQSLQADQDLQALIPDSALQNPDAWAIDTDAARTGAPPATLIEQIEADTVMPDIAGTTIAWPDGSELPEITPLVPDPDIEVAEQSIDATINTLPGQEENDTGAGIKLVNADIVRVGKQVELAFPRGADAIADIEAIAARFAGLSVLKSFDGDKDSLAQIVRRARTDRELLINIMRIHGYHDAQVYQSLAGLSAPVGDEVAGPIDVEQVVVRFDLQPGPQYLLGSISFGDLDAASSAVEMLRGTFKLNSGDAINADRVVVERLNLQRALGESGYAFAKVGEPSQLIDHARRAGDLTIPVTPGGRYTIGRLVSSRATFLSSRHLDRIARFDSGSAYKQSEIDDLRQAILATGLVSSVTVETREVTKPIGETPGTVDVDVTLTPAPLRTIAGLVGYSSGEGFRLEGQWEHRNIFPPEGMLRVRGVVGTQEQLAGLTFRRNNFLQRDLTFNSDLYARNQVSPAFEALTISAIAGLERQTTLLFQKPWIFAGGVEILATRERDAAAIRANAPRTTYFIAALPLRAAYDGSDSLLDPTRGFKIGLRASPEISVQNSVRSSYGRVQLDASYYQRASDSVVVAGRVRFGTIMGAPIGSIAPSRRFYAGGGGSVRGYGFQQIGPRDALNAPSGGRALSEFSLEARVKTGIMGGAVSIVPFVDAGAVDTTTRPSFQDLKIGVGVGVRYQTNFGPIRIDVGTPLKRLPGDSLIGVYVALGQAF